MRLVPVWPREIDDFRGIVENTVINGSSEKSATELVIRGGHRHLRKLLPGRRKRRGRPNSPGGTSGCTALLRLTKSGRW